MDVGGPSPKALVGSIDGMECGALILLILLIIRTTYINQTRQLS